MDMTRFEVAESILQTVEDFIETHKIKSDKDVMDGTKVSVAVLRKLVLDICETADYSSDVCESTYDDE